MDGEEHRGTWLALHHQKKNNSTVPLLAAGKAFP